MKLLILYLAITYLIPTMVIRTKLLPSGVNGMAVLPFVVLVKPDALESTIVHEKIHIKQYKRYTWFGFYVVYFYNHFKHGYWNNPLEVEARGGK